MTALIYLVLLVTSPQVFLCVNGAVTVTPSNTSITVAWTASPEYKNVTITLDGTAVTDIDTTEASSFDITGLQPGNAYRIAVKGYSTSDDSPVDIHAETTYNTAPFQPTNLMATPGTNYVILRWTSGHPSTQSYKITYGVPEISATSNMATYTVPNLKSGVTYTVKVYAVTNSVLSVPAVISSTTEPAMPVNLVNSTTTPTSITLRWSAMKTSHQDSFSLSYREVSSLSSSIMVPNLSPAANVTYTIRNLRPGRNYSIMVWAVKYLGDGHIRGYKASIFVCTTPLPPSNTSVAAISTTQLRVQWTEAANSQQDSYRVTYQYVGSGVDTDAGCTSSPCVIDASGNNPGSSYLITVYAVSGGTQSAGATANGNTKPEKPGDLTVFMVTSNTLTLNSDVPPASTVESTNIKISPSLASTANSQVAMVGSSYKITLSGLEAGAMYSIDFSTTSGSEESEIVRGTFYTIPTTPNPPSRESATTDSLTVTWTQPDGALDKYVVSIMGGESKNVTKLGDKKVTFTGLTAGKTYTVTLRTFVGSGTSEVMSETASASMTIKPMPATNIALKTRTVAYLTVTWQAPTVGELTAFIARLKGVPASERSIQKVSPYEATFSSLTAGTEFTVEIITVSGNINSEVTKAMFYTIPSGPVNLRQTQVSDVSISITWESPTAGGWDKYEANILPNGGSETKSDLAKTAITYQFTGLSPATKHTITLRSLVSAVPSAAQSIVVYTNPNPPKSITFSSKTTNSVMLIWTGPSHPVNSYKYSVSKSGESAIAASGTTSSTSAVITNLEAGATYDVTIISQIQTETGSGSESVSLASRVTMVPNDARSLREKDRGQTYIEVEWDDPANEFSSFELTISGSTQKFSVSKGLQIYKFSNLDRGQSYTITVVTVSGTEKSSGTSVTLQTNPSNVQELNLGLVTSTSIPVSWVEPTNTVIGSFQLRISPNDGNEQLPIQVAKGKNYFYLFENLKPGRQYTLSISVKTGSGTSGQVDKTATTKPSPVSQLEVVPGTIQTTSFQIQWMVNQDSMQQSFKISYIQVDGGNIKEDMVDFNQGLSYSRSISQLEPGKTYTMSVNAISQKVNGDVVSFNQTTRPSRVSKFTGVVKGPSSVDLTWTPDGRSVQNAYELKYQSQIKTTTWTSPVTIIDTSNTVQNLFPGDKYTFDLVAVSNGQKSESFQIQKVTKPLPPPGLKVSSVTTNSINAAWDYDNTKSYNTKYKIYRSLTATSNPIYVTTTGDTSSRAVVVNGLTSGGNYTLSVYSLTFDDIESLSASTVDATVEPVISSILSDVTEETTNTTAVIAYTASTAGVFDKYKISLTSDSGTSTITKTKDEQDRKVKFDTLEAGKSYVISAVTTSGLKESTPTTLNVVTKPNPPAISCLTYATGLQVTLDKSYGEVHKYIVECIGKHCQTPLNLDVFNSAEKVFHNYTNLLAYEEYTIKVKSEVTYGSTTKQSSQSQRICRTSQSAPEAVTSFNYTDIKPYELKLYWEDPSVRNGVITGYQIRYKGTKTGKVDIEWEDLPLITDGDDKTAFTERKKLIEDLRGGYTYMFSIQAKTIDIGAYKNFTVVMPVEAPWKNQTILAASAPKTSTFTHDWVDVQLTDPFSNRHGDITGYSVIVLNNVNSIEPGKDITTTWSTASSQNPMPAYAAIFKCPDLFKEGNACWGYSVVPNRRRRALGEAVTIRVGGDLDCSLSTSEYCNGPLQPGSSYNILLRAYTENGQFSDTPFSKQFTTAPKPIAAFLIPTIVAIVVILVLAIVMLTVIVMWRKGKICRGDESEDGYEFHSDYLDRPRSSRFSYSNSVHKKEFGSHVRLMAADCDFRFAEEFESLKPVGTDAPHRASEEDANRLKNRFTNILPYDHARVKLLPTDDEEGSDYINASWMPGYNSKREFIVCQGPLPATRDDFWRMVWEHHAVAIVMLTGCVEKGKEKCDHYWPVDTEPMFYGDLQVVILNETKSPHWVMTEFKISKGEHSRRLCHYHFIAWKDFGVPEEGPGILVKFVRLVRDRLGHDRSPIVVHCSAGVGRSGTYIAVDNLMQRIREHDSLDVLATVYDMRRHRCFMVQTEQQYIFIHQCLLFVLEKREKEQDLYDITSNENEGYEHEHVRGTVDTVADMFFQLAPRQALSSNEDLKVRWRTINVQKFVYRPQDAQEKAALQRKKQRSKIEKLLTLKNGTYYKGMQDEGIG